MKLRIKGNSLRFRLTKQEVGLIASSGIISESVDFGVNQFSYVLEKGGNSTIKATFVDGTILISIPIQLVNNWANSEEEGISSEISINGKVLKVLIEKDFACLKIRKDEDESDMFNNPDSDNFKC